MHSLSEINKILYNVSDPEIPVLSIMDLGIIRKVEFEGKLLVITITPTYSGCPAMKVIEEDITSELAKNGITDFKVNTILSPAWTTDWLTKEGRKKLKEFGIAPPVGTSADKSVLFGNEKIVPCPYCKSKNTKLISQFGSTACKALYKCDDCLEPFDYFKCL